MLSGFLLLAALSSPAPAPIPEPSEVLALTDEMKAFLDDRVDRKGAPVEKMRRIVELIFDEKELHFQYDKSRTKTASETFRERSGNCLSFTLLFTAMARHLGVDVHFQQVQLPPSWDKHGDLIVSTQHVNAVADIEGVRWEIDLAASVNPLRLGAQVVPDERGLANFYSNRAVDFLGRGDSEGALRYIEQAIQLDPTAAFAWANQAVLLSSQGRFQEAEASYLRALDLDGQRLCTMDNLVRLYRKMGRHAEAERYRKKVASYRNKNPFYHYHLGITALEANEAKRAVEHFKQAIKRRKHDDSFYFALARAYTRLGELKKASENLRKAQEHSLDQAARDRYNQKLRWLEIRQKNLLAHASVP